MKSTRLLLRLTSTPWCKILRKMCYKMPSARCKQDSTKDAFGKGLVSEASFEKSYGVSFNKPIFSF